MVLSLLRQSSRNRVLTEKEVKLELGSFFSDILKEDTKRRKRKFNMVRQNILLGLREKPSIRFKTKKIFEGFETFLDKFEK